MTDQYEYDPRTCVTAGELRAAGLAIPDTIPDVGWVPRDSIMCGEPMPVYDETGTVAVGLEVIFAVLFRWLKVDFTIEGAQNGDDVV